MLEGFPPGGVTDLASRTIAERMGPELSQTGDAEVAPDAGRRRAEMGGVIRRANIRLE